MLQSELFFLAVSLVPLGLYSIPSGKFLQFAIEHDPVEIVDLCGFTHEKHGGSFQFVVCERLPGRVYPLFGFNLSSRGVHNPKKMVGIQLIQLNYVRAK